MGILIGLLVFLFVIAGPLISSVVSELIVDQPAIKQPTKVFPGEFKESKCKGIGVRFEDGYFKITSASIKPLPATSMTFVAWIRVRDTDKSATIYSTMAADGGKQVLEVNPSTENKVNGFLKWSVKKDKTNMLFDIESDGKISSGIWTHVVAKYDGAQGKAYLFINGDKIAKIKDAPKAAKLPWGTDVMIGGLTNDKGKVTASFTGGMMGIRFVEKPLTDIKMEFDSCKPEQSDQSPYLVTVCSADKLLSGTTSTVYVKVYGDKGQFGEIKIGSSFRSGCSKTITIYGPCVGIVDKISVRKDPSLIAGKTWTLEKIVITAERIPNKAEKYTFLCKACKFSKKDGLQRFIEGTREVSGGWSAWSDWSGCGSGLCGGDKKVRTRACTNPEPNESGLKCKKKDGSHGIFEAEPLACPVDGGWGSWSEWSDCQKPCGGFTVKRTRKCDNPATGNGGKPCSGPDSETKQDCIEPCEDWPVHGDWAEWGQWSACSKTCGGGTVTRKRTCTNPAPLRGGSPCEGDDTMTAIECTKHCPIDGNWNKWMEWSDCSKTCGEGQQTRERECTKPPPAYDGKACPGQPKETKKCKKMDCPNSVDGKWGSWGPWSACSETQFCDQGEKTRTRKCDKPAPSNGGKLCPGMDTEEKVCPTAKCKAVDGDSIKVKPQSYIAETCKASTAYFAGDKGTKAKDIPTTIFTEYLAGIASIIKTSYFSQTKEKVGDDEVNKFCFQPARAIPIKTLKTVFKEYKDAKTLPDFVNPTDTDTSNGLSVSLKEDGSLFSVEFSLADSDKYSPRELRDIELEDVRFVFRERPGKSETLAYATHKVINNVFTVEVIPGPFLVGNSPGKTTLGEIVTQLTPKTDVYAAYINGGIGKAIKDIFFNRLKILAVKDAPATGLTEAAKGNEHRISCTVTSKDNDLFKVESILNWDKWAKFAIGLTTDKTELNNTLEKVLNRTLPEFFSELVDTAFGIAYSPLNFISNDETAMQNEPLKSGLAGVVKEGLFVAFITKLPTKCMKTICKVAKAIVGKEGQLLISGNIHSTGIDLMASIVDRKISDKYKLSKIEFWIKTTYKPPKATFYLNFELTVTVDGEVYKDNILQPQKELVFVFSLDVSTTSEVGLTADLNKWAWRNVFGCSYLSMTDMYLSIAFSVVTAGFPTRFAIGATAEFGKDCNEEKDFEKDGHCIKATINLGLSVVVTEIYFIGEISAVTVGKIIRMLGRNIELPEYVAETGFQEALQISYASKTQVITYLSTDREITSGLIIKGKLKLFALPAVAVSFLLSKLGISLSVELDPVDLSNKVQIVRSLKDKTKGPIFSIEATTTVAEIFLHGAVKIFGAELEIKFEFRPRLIEAQAIIALTIGKVKLGADVHIEAKYGPKGPLKSFSFMAKITLTAERVKIEEEANKEATKQVSKAKELIETLKKNLVTAKESCKKKVTVYCQQCQDIKCEQVKESCNEALDSNKNYIGGVANKFGLWFAGAARQIAKTFKTERERRSAEFFPGRAQVATRLRRKRFVGRYMCKHIVPKICSKSRTFCEATCKLPQHLHKGLCKGLDLTHKSLYKSEQAFSWIKKTVPKYMLKIHEVSFELQVQPSLVDTSVTASIDFTFMDVRKKLTAQLTLQDVVNMGIVIANKAMEAFRKLVSPRFTQPAYDRPDNVGDFKTGAPFRIVNGNNMCMTSPNDKTGSTYGTGLCSSQDSLWVYTLTGELINIGAEKCVTFSGSGSNQQVDQQECQIGFKNQHLYCENNRIHPSVDPSNCLIQKAKSVQVAPCAKPPEDDTKEFEIPKEEEWIVDGRLNVCEKFVQDLALGKPAEQSSSFSQKELDAEELKEIDPKIKDTIIKKVGPELAVDGNMNVDIAGGSCAHTAHSKDSWWRVDLQAEHVITDVSIQTGSENIKVDALQNFEIRVGMQKQFEKNPMCGIRVKGIHLGELWTSTCDPYIPGRYVSIQSFGMNRMTLCEVAVYSRTDNQGKCSSELNRRRSEIATVCHRDRIFRRPMITYGIRYDA